eukprot:756161-Hanusia_phi.AAC.1
MCKKRDDSRFRLSQPLNDPTVPGGKRWRDDQIPGFVPGMDPEAFAATQQKPKSQHQRRNENRKKRKEEEAKAGVSVDDVEGGVGKVTLKEEADKTEQAPVDPKEALQKRIRNLKKKLKQIEELKSKADKGELTPNQEQADKIASKPAVEEEIKTLEEELAAMA